MKRALLAALLSAVSAAALAAEPVKIGITTILSTPIADRGQSEQYGAQLALNEINRAGGVLGRPVEVFYADNACKPDVGVPATKRLIEQVKVPVIIGALCTPVTKAIEPVVKDAKIPLIIATSAGQDFVDRSGIGGNDYLFKTIPSETDIAIGLVRYLKSKNVKSIAIVADNGGFMQANAVAIEKAAKNAGLTVTGNETLAQGTTDFGPTIDKLKAGKPDVLWTMPGGFTGGLFKALAASDWKIPVTGRFEIGAAAGLTNPTAIAVFTPALDKPAVQKFVASYQAHYGLMPTQRSFFVYEAVYLATDAIRRAKSDTPAAIHKALKTTAMPSRLGGTYKVDDHNHAHTPLFIVGLKDGKPSVIATE
jgi:branched-chain amino acid transport system substrate-binding protein